MDTAVGGTLTRIQILVLGGILLFTDFENSLHYLLLILANYILFFYFSEFCKGYFCNRRFPLNVFIPILGILKLCSRGI